MHSKAWEFATDNTKALILRGPNEGLAVNLNGDTLLTNEICSYSFMWTEE